MQPKYYIKFRGDHPGVRYWNGEDWVPDVRDAAHYTPRDLPDEIPSARGLYDLECSDILIGATGDRPAGVYETPEEYDEAIKADPDDQIEWLDDEYGDSYYEILLVEEEEEEEE